MSKKKNYKELLTTPYETGIKNFSSIAKFYQYYAPCIDSAQTSGCFDDTKSEEVFKSMLKVNALESKTRILKRLQPASWKKDGFDTDILDFEESKILCDKFNNESELHALLRHIRNSLAHGYIYVWRKRKGDFIFLVDFDSNKHKQTENKPKPTAKIMVSMPILERWKEIIESEIV